MKMTAVTMIAAEISIWATEPIWSSVWKRWQIKHCQSAFHSGGSHLQTLHGEYGGSAELQSHCDAQLQKTTWQDIFLAAQNGWVAARPLRHDTMPSWNDLCWNFQMESQERQIPHLSLCPSLPKPCGARLGNRQLHKGFFKTLSVWSNRYQVAIHDCSNRENVSALCNGIFVNNPCESNSSGCREENLYANLAKQVKNR